MTRLNKLIIALTMLFLFSLIVPMASAATLIIGNGDSGSRYPLGLDPSSATSAFPDFAAGGIYQQVYDASSFPGPVTITQIAFASNGNLSAGPGMGIYDFNLALSTTGVGPGALSTDLAANRGTGIVQVFSGPLNAALTANNQVDLIINITPFNYDPADGNLLMEITVNAPSEFAGNRLYFVAGSDAHTNRAANPSGLAGGAFTDSFGLLTRFTVGAPTAAAATISGEITDASGAKLPGVTVTLSGGASATTITDKEGKYLFENLATNNIYTVTPELANYIFTPRSSAVSLVGNNAEGVFTGANNGGVFINVIDANEFFVRQQYLDFLNREPDRQGLAYWTSQLAQCEEDAACVRDRRVEVSAAFFQSLEFQQSGSYIYRLYEGALGRQPKYTEFVADRRHVVGGANLDADKIAFVREFTTRPAFIEKYEANTTAESFVDALLHNQLLATGVDLTSERDELIRRYGSGHTLSEARARALFNVAENAAFVKAMHNPAFVEMEYFGYLQREIDQQGYAFWLNILNDRDSGNYRGMVCSFITSAEYQQRFGAITHSNADCAQ